MKKYLISSTAVTIVLILAIPLSDLLPFDLHQYYGWLVGFFFFQSVGISWLLALGEKDKGKFGLFAMGSVVLRFVTGVLFLLIFFVLGVEKSNLLVIQFMAIYLVHLAFELTLVLTNLRPN